MNREEFTEVPMVIPGSAVHRELVESVRTGLTPYEALVTGARNVAADVGTANSTAPSRSGRGQSSSFSLVIP